MPFPVGCESAGRTRPATGGMWRAWLGEQREPRALAEQAVEQALMLADDADCLDDLAAVLRGVLWPNIKVADVVDDLESLMSLAADAAREELWGTNTAAYAVAVDDYKAALADFAEGGDAVSVSPGPDRWAPRAPWAEVPR